MNALARGLGWTLLKGQTWCKEHLAPSLEVLFDARPSGMNPFHLALGWELLGDLLTIVEGYASAVRSHRRGERANPEGAGKSFADDIALALQMAGMPRDARREIVAAIRFPVSRGARVRASAPASFVSVDHATAWRGRVAERLLAGDARRVLSETQDVPLGQGWDLRAGAHAILGHTTEVYRVLEDMRETRVPVAISSLFVFVLPDGLRESPLLWRALACCAVTDSPALIPSRGTDGTGIGLDDAESFARAMLSIHVARTASDYQLLEELMEIHPSCSCIRSIGEFWRSNGRPPTWQVVLEIGGRP